MEYHKEFCRVVKCKDRKNAFLATEGKIGACYWGGKLYSCPHLDKDDFHTFIAKKEFDVKGKNKNEI